MLIGLREKVVTNRLQLGTFIISTVIHTSLQLAATASVWSLLAPRSGAIGAPTSVDSDWQQHIPKYGNVRSLWLNCPSPPL